MATILVVDDEPALLEVTRRILHRAGFHVLVAHGGQAAVDLARTSPARIDLVVTDVVMPDLSGYEVARALRELDPDIRVLYLSGFAVPAPGDEGALAAELVPKPFTAVDLLGAVRAVLAR